MLSHLNVRPNKPRRVVVMGGGGFIGGAILRRLIANEIETISLGRLSLDLLGTDSVRKLSHTLTAHDTFVFVSAKAPCKDLPTLIENTAMLDVVCAALQLQPVFHLVYVSSDAVYKDSSEPISEASCAEPNSLHGLMHLTREVVLKQAFAGAMAILRPTLVYGHGDPHNGYGPNRFSRLAAAGKEIVLFGEGEERRDHVDVEDVAELAYQIILHRSIGVVNAVSGEVASFREIAEYSSSAFTPRVRITGTPRTGLMPHNGYRPFENSTAVKTFPGFRFKGWREGLTIMYAKQVSDKMQGYQL